MTKAKKKTKRKTTVRRKPRLYTLESIEALCQRYRDLKAEENAITEKRKAASAQVLDALKQMDAKTVEVGSYRATRSPTAGRVNVKSFKSYLLAAGVDAKKITRCERKATGDPGVSVKITELKEPVEVSTVLREEV